jgi:hypothetical protein
MYIEGGRNSVVDEIIAASDADKSLTHWAKLDIANCFDNINLARAHEVLPVKRKVIQHTIGINSQEGIDRRQNEHIRHSRLTIETASTTGTPATVHGGRRLDSIYSEERNQSFASRYPLMLPQGAACSPFVAYWLIEEGLSPMNAARAFMFGDDLLILGRSEYEVHAEAYRFVDLFATHSAGPLQVGCLEFGRLDDGVDFLGLEITAPEEPAQQCARVALSLEKHHRFKTTLREKAVRGFGAGDAQLSEANAYLTRFLAGSPPQVRPSIKADAVGAIARLHGQPEVVFDTDLPRT